MTRTPFLAAATVAARVASSPAAAGECPVSEMAFNSGDTFTSSAAAFDTVASATRELAYDIPAGTLALRHDGKFTTFVRVNDTFLLNGAAPGTPVSAWLVMVADGEVSTGGCGGSNCWGYFGVRAWTDDASDEDITGANVFTGSSAVHAHLELPIQFIVGQPKEIAIELAASSSADHRVTGQATFQFFIPSNLWITSCRNYIQLPTPASETSWGRVKAAYR